MSDEWTFCYEAIGPVATDTAGLTYPRHFLQHAGPDVRARMTMLLSKPLPAELDLDGIAVRTLPAITGTGPGKALAAQAIVPLLTGRMGVDVVFCSGSIASAFAGRAGGPPLVVNVQNAAPLDTGVITAGRGRDTYRRIAVPAGLKRAAKVITTSETVGDALVERYGLDPAGLSVIPLAADEERFHPIVPGEDRFETTGIERPYILFVSALWGYKNASALVAAYAEVVREEKIPHLLVLAGKDGGDGGNCRRIAREAGIEDRVIFVGHASDPLLPALYRHADLFVYPSLIESFGLPLLEAMGSGCPVVASNRWAIPEICGDAARTCDPNPTDLAREIAAVLSSPEERERLRSAGLRRSKQFSWRRTIEETVAVIESVARSS